MSINNTSKNVGCLWLGHKHGAKSLDTCCGAHSLSFSFHMPKIYPLYWQLGKESFPNPSLNSSPKVSNNRTNTYVLQNTAFIAQYQY